MAEGESDREARTRADLLDVLGLPPHEAVLATVALEICREADDDRPQAAVEGVTVQRLSFRNMLGETVPIVIVVPDAAIRTGSRSAPAVVCLAGTSGDAEQCTAPALHKAEPAASSGGSRGALSGWARELSRRGFVTVSVTLRGHDMRNGKGAEQSGVAGAYARQWGTEMKLMAPFGLTMMGVMVRWPLRRPCCPQPPLPTPPPLPPPLLLAILAEYIHGSSQAVPWTTLHVPIRPWPGRRDSTGHRSAHAHNHRS